jgi:hypothetical protein
VTGRTNPVVRRRASDLGIEDVPRRLGLARAGSGVLACAGVGQQSDVDLPSFSTDFVHRSRSARASASRSPQPPTSRACSPPSDAKRTRRSSSPFAASKRSSSGWVANSCCEDVTANTRNRSALTHRDSRRDTDASFDAQPVQAVPSVTSCRAPRRGHAAALHEVHLSLATYRVTLCEC